MTVSSLRVPVWFVKIRDLDRYVILTRMLDIRAELTGIHMDYIGQRALQLPVQPVVGIDADGRLIAYRRPHLQHIVPGPATAPQ